MNRVLENRYYYLDNFETVLQWISQRYSDLLNEDERQFLTQFPFLSKASRALLVRMIMRKGTLFRSGKLNYDEIGDTPTASGPLLQLGWVDDKPVLTLAELFGLFTKPEVARIFHDVLPNPSAKKSEQLQALQIQFSDPRPLEAWGFDTPERIYHLRVMPLCERFRLMFFGNLRQDWSEFVLSDLGLYTYEKVEFSPSSRGFQTRRDVDYYLHLHRCRERLDQGEAINTVVQGIPACAHENDWLERRRAKLLFQIAQSYERRHEWSNALGLYSQCQHPGARARAIRVLERDGRFESAYDLAKTALQAPESEAETQQLSRIVPRLLRKLGQPRALARAAAPRSKASLNLAKPSAPYSVEALVRDYLLEEQGPVYYVENTLINSLFGLLCWPALFTAIPGAFFHPFQRSPADLHSAGFYQRRQQHFEACLSQLDSNQYKDTIVHNFNVKANMQSVFVAWAVLNDEIIDLALSCIPALHLKKWFERILQDIKSNCSGFPDLIQFWPDEKRYQMIEVKGPGDRLQDNQLRWLDYCAAHAMPVSVCYVRWNEATA